MRAYEHLSPRYVADRAAWAWYQRRNPDTPWLTPTANHFLAQVLRPDDVAIEWGSGRSTAWFAQWVGTLTSVEDDRAWYERVQGILQEKGRQNVDYVFTPNPGTTADATSSEYVSVVDRFADGSVDFALVDGSAREHCALRAIPKIAPGGLLVVDDSHWYFDQPTRSPASRHGLGVANESWAEVLERTADWRAYWTSNGVKDTAIFLRP